MQTKFFTCLLGLIFFSSTIWASTLFDFSRTMDNGGLTGQVRDKNSGLPLAGATISLPDLKVTVTTDAQGNFSIGSLPNGSFTISVSYVGYRSWVGTVAIHNSTQKNFELSVSIVENETVVVTGVSASTQLKQAPTHISVLGREALQQSAGSNLMEALAREPGVAIITTGPAIAKPAIRGLGFNRVVTINDGMRQEGQQWGDEHGVEIDEYSAQKVEILRGPASLMYGSDAIGGVLNILTNIPVTNNTVKANLSANMNSNNRMWGGYANIAGNINGLNWNWYGTTKSAGDYQNRYDGAVLNSRFQEKNMGGYVGLNKSWGFSHLLFSSFNQRVGMIEGERNATGAFELDGYLPNTNPRWERKVLVPNQQIQHVKLALDNAFALQNSGRITALMGFQQNQRREFADPDHPLEPEAFFDLKTLNYATAYHFPVLNGWKNTLGLNGMLQNNKNRAEEALIPDYRLSDMGIFAFSSKTLHRSTISGGIRYDHRHITGSPLLEDEVVHFVPFSKNLSSVSGSLGAAHSFNDFITLKLNASKGFRAPNVAELSANGIHEGTFRYELGNLDLKSETSWALDAGLEINNEHFFLNVSPYFNQINHYIYYQKLQTQMGTDSIREGQVAYQFTQQSARLWGVEANVDIHPHPLDWLHFENTFSWTRGKFNQRVDGSNNLPLIAPMRLLTELRGEFPRLIPGIQNIFLKIEMDHVTSQNHFFSGYNTETATPGYTLFNAGLGAELFIKNIKRATLYLTVNNVTDRSYQNHLSRLKYAPENPVTGRQGVFNMGRNTHLRLLIPFEWAIGKK